VTNFFEFPGLDPLAKALVEIPCSVPGGKLEGGNLHPSQHLSERYRKNVYIYI